MFKKVLLTAAAAAAVAAVPAGAVTRISVEGAFDAPGTGGPITSFNFNSGSKAIELANLDAAGFNTAQTGFVDVVQGTQERDWVSPNPGDDSAFVAVLGNSSFTITSKATNTDQYNAISLYVGSVDSYNSITILDKAGNEIQTFLGSQLLSAPSTPNSTTSYRITFTRDAGEAAFGGLRIESTGNSAEFDNLVFAVPEPSTWALMLAGFGMVGMAMRARRRRTSVVFG